VKYLLIGIVAITSLVGAAAEVGGGYSGEPGPYAIAARPDLVFEDTERGKHLSMRVTWPDGEGPFPLIVWSHGYLGSKDAYGPLVEHWASHGYVVIQPTHSDSLSLLPRGERMARLREPFEFTGEGGLSDWRNRPLDVRLILDSLDWVEGEIPELSGRIDREHIGVGGHSFGAFTTQLLAGVCTTEPGAEAAESHADPRVDAALMISPQGRDTLLRDGAWDTLTGPAMVITGTHDRGRNREPGTWRKEPYDFAPEGDKFLVWIEGAHHSMGGITGHDGYTRVSGGLHPEQVLWIQMTSLAFWDRTLKQDAGAQAFLAGEEIETVSEGSVELSAK
jgi:dienelactone hydrolase